MEFTGIITFIGEFEDIETKNGIMQKRSIVLTEDKEEYPSSIAFDEWKKQKQIFDGCAVSDLVNVHLNCTAREYNGKFYNSISAWRVDKKNKPNTQLDDVDLSNDLPF